ncbi:sensor histidine kinase [Massilia soli]|uniref:Histidine kinase n=1 Tax=Massilia soli TaxID=2792854 RepID=A0ABS7SPF0_9BURK|nr:histidine kinase [Massilia soli]MBZ2207959.1 histidine kinase [Massilia soli]
MADHFFPRARTFWMYHCSALAVGLAVTVAMAAAWGSMSAYQIVSSIVWMPIYTIAVLAFRKCYRSMEVHRPAMVTVIAATVAYSAVAGVLIAFVLVALLLPLFWEQFAARYAEAGIAMTAGRVLLDRLLDHAPQSQLFVCVWSFIYISVATARKAAAAELFNLRLANNLKDAQLSNLSNQLNPHFLFNSLNNIRFMIHEDARSADAMITSLSEILRYSLESATRDKVRVSDEIAIVRKYLAIVGTQYDGRHAFHLHVPASLQSQLIPPMTLQMLAENAVKHGLDQLRDGGSLSVDISEQDERLLLDVRNDAPADGARQPGMGIGLRNIEQRLGLLYGTGATLAASAHPGGFHVRIALPKESA